MELYGEYEVVRQISTVANFRIRTFIARHRSGKTDAQFVVRFFPKEESPDATAALADGLDELSANGYLAFLESVQHQKTAYDAGAANIAPIHAFEHDARGTWYVTDFYPRGTLYRLIVGRYQPDAEDVYHLIEALLRGLLDLRKYCGRTHGNLIPNNILLGGIGGKRLRDTAILLSEPLAGKADKAVEYEIADLHALGEIIYQLIRRREIKTATHWPLQASEDWLPLGKYADGWRELCNELVDPHLSLQNLDLLRLQTRLLSLKPKVSLPAAALAQIGRLLERCSPSRWPVIQKTTRNIIIGGVAIALLAVAIIGYLRLRTKPHTPIAPPTEAVKLPTHPPTNATSYPSHETPTNTDVLPAPTTGSVELRTRPPGAEIRQNGNLLPEKTPSTLTQLTPGEVNYELKLDGYETTNLTAVVRAGETVSLGAQLTDVRIPVTLSSEPEGAEIRIDGKLVGRTPLTDPLRLLPREYEVTARYKDWPEQTRRIVVARGQPVEAPPFKFLTGTVVINSRPTGAAVWLEGKSAGTTDGSFDVKPGETHWELRLAGYQSTNLVAVVEAEKKTRLEVRLSDLPVPVEISSEPRGATILIDGARVETTPASTAYLVTPGEHQVTARYKDWPEQTQTLTVLNNQPARLPLFKFINGVVQVDSNPSGAAVLLGGKPAGETPFRLPSVKPGVFSVDLQKEGYLPVTVTTNVTPGQTVALQTDLLRSNEGGQLILTSNLERVEFIVNGRSIGTPKIPAYLAVAPGDWKISARFHNLAELNQPAITIAAGQSVEVPFNFPPPCKNVLITDPPGATVRLDTKLIGKTPCTNYVSLAEVVPTGGKIIYRFEVDGYIAKVVTNDYGPFKIIVSDFEKTPPGN